MRGSHVHFDRVVARLKAPARRCAQPEAVLAPAASQLAARRRATHVREAIIVLQGAGKGGGSRVWGGGRGEGGTAWGHWAGGGMPRARPPSHEPTNLFEHAQAVLP